MQDVFDPHITLMAPDSVDTSLESLSANRSIAGGEELLFSFLGTKGPGGLHSARAAGTRVQPSDGVACAVRESFFKQSSPTSSSSGGS